MEALLLAGGKAERLGAAAQGLPKPLVPVAGYPIAEYTVARLVDAGVTRVIVACRGGDEEIFVTALAGLGAEIDVVGEETPLGRGGGLRLAASRRAEGGPVLALNGDELLDVDFPALLADHERAGAAATIVVAQVNSPFGVVDLEADGTVSGFREGPKLEHWVNSGVYVLGEDALALLPEQGDHEQSTFPQLAAERRLRAHRHEGVWLTVNTPKDLRRATEFIDAHPEWKPQRQNERRLDGAHQ
jgi:NDP-sugar pyrophosphorylase family protein